MENPFIPVPVRIMQDARSLPSSIQKGAGINIPVGVSEGARTADPIFDPGSIKAVSIQPGLGSRAVALVVLPAAGIRFLVRLSEGSFTVALVIFPGTDVFITTGPEVGSPTLTFVVLPLADIFFAIRPDLGTRAMALSRLPFPTVMFQCGGVERAETVTLSVAEFADILVAAFLKQRAASVDTLADTFGVRRPTARGGQPKQGQDQKIRGVFITQFQESHPRYSVMV